LVKIQGALLEEKMLTMSTLCSGELKTQQQQNKKSNLKTLAGAGD